VAGEASHKRTVLRGHNRYVVPLIGGVELDRRSNLGVPAELKGFGRLLA
jgi:hypothetical protein